MMTPELPRTGAIAVNDPSLTLEERKKARDAALQGALEAALGNLPGVA